jgi:hypothetical protein
MDFQDPMDLQEIPDRRVELGLQDLWGPLDLRVLREVRVSLDPVVHKDLGELQDSQDPVVQEVPRDQQDPLVLQVNVDPMVRLDLLDPVDSQDPQGKRAAPDRLEPLGSLVLQDLPVHLVQQEVLGPLDLRVPLGHLDFLEILDL